MLTRRSFIGAVAAAAVGLAVGVGASVPAGLLRRRELESERLVRLMNEAMARASNLAAGRPVYYMSRKLYEELNSIVPYAETFRGIPIRVRDDMPTGEFILTQNRPLFDDLWHPATA